MKNADNNCEYCNGKGALTHHRIVPEFCRKCDGTGKKPTTKEILKRLQLVDDRIGERESERIPMSAADSHLENRLPANRDSLDCLVRHAFEKWISSPPYEREIDRWPQDETKHSWPGQYKDITVEVAWDAWQEAITDMEREKSMAYEIEAKTRIALGWLVRACEQRIPWSQREKLDEEIQDAKRILSNVLITESSPKKD